MEFNVYDYIPSPDVAARCKERGMTFKPEEQAVLVYLSGKTLEERLHAYAQLAELHKGYTFSRQRLFRGREVAISECLLKTIEYERECVASFMAAGDDVLFCPCCTIQRKKIRNYGYDLDYDAEYEGGLYRSFEDALAELQTVFGEEEHNDLHAYRIRRLKIGERYPETASARILLDGTLIDADGTGGCDDELSEMSEAELWQMLYVYLPTPFQRGDIISKKERGCERVFVFDGAYDDEHPERRAYREAFSDTTDMTARALFCDDEGRIYYDTVIHNTDLCHFKGELPDECLMLECMSDVLKNDTDLWDFNVTATILRHIYAIKDQIRDGYRLDDRQRRLLRKLAEEK